MAAKAVILWRISKHTPQYGAADMRGEGANIFGGRWNSKGNHLVYSSTTIALATLETLAHIGDDIKARNRFLVAINVPQAVWKNRIILKQEDLDPTWIAEPAGLTTITAGDDWIAGMLTPILMVPSVIIPEEFNVLINPKHPLTARITAQVNRQFIYDPRL